MKKILRLFEKLIFGTRGAALLVFCCVHNSVREQLPTQTRRRMPKSTALPHVQCRVEREIDYENYKDEVQVGSEEQSGLSCPSLSELAFWMEIDLPSPRDVGDYPYRNQTGMDKIETFGNMKNRKPLSDAPNDVKLFSNCRRLESCQRIISPEYPTSSSSDDDASDLYNDLQTSLWTGLQTSKSSGGGHNRPGCTPVAGYLPQPEVLTCT